MSRLEWVSGLMVRMCLLAIATMRTDVRSRVVWHTMATSIENTPSGQDQVQLKVHTRRPALFVPPSPFPRGECRKVFWQLRSPVDYHTLTLVREWCTLQCCSDTRNTHVWCPQLRACQSCDNGRCHRRNLPQLA
jgi:hypothetical protein